MTMEQENISISSKGLNAHGNGIIQGDDIIAEGEKINEVSEAEKIKKGICPSCGGGLVFQEGCKMCYSCGWGGCS
jgi:hypothetical protein